MDQSLASLYPIHQIGSDGFSWWIGQIESDKKDDPKRSGRYRVRIIGQHLNTGENATPTEELPWAHIMMPVTTPFIEGGTGGASPGLQRGCFVVGFYLDNDKQKPIIMGSIGGVKGATKESNDDPGGPLNFKAIKDSKVNPQQNRSTDTQSGKNEDGANTDKGVVDADKSDVKGGAPPILVAAYAKHSETNPTGGKSCVVIANPNCGNENNLKNGLTRIMGDLLAANQAASGQIGDFYVSKINGLLYDGVGQARYHIGRVVRLVKSFIARGKTEVIKALRGAVDYLNKTILTTETTVGYAAQGPYKDPEEAFVPIKEKSNRLKKVKEIFDNIFADLGCSIADITDLIARFITDLIMGYLTDVFNNAACFIDTLIDGILNEILAQFDALVNRILAPIQAILEAIAAPLNFIGGIINKFMRLLGISCTGPSQKCEPIQEKCVDCGTNDGQNDLDRLLDAIERGLDGSQAICDESTILPSPRATSIVFIGGVFDDPTNASTNVTPGDSDDDSTIDYDIPDVDVDNEIDTPNTPSTIPGSATATSPVTPAGPAVNLPTDDTEPFIDVYTDESLFVEGDVVTYNIVGVNIPDGTLFDYILSGPSITDDDIVGDLNGTFIMNGNQATVSVTINEDDDEEELAPELLVFTATGSVDVIENGVTTTFPLQAATDVVIDSDGVSPPDDIITNDNLIPVWNVTTDKPSYLEGEDVIVTVTTQNVADGTIVDYFLIGSGITGSDFVTGSLTGSFEVNSGTAQFVLGIADDTEAEGDELVNLILSGTGASTQFTILEDPNDLDSGIEEDDQELFLPKKPTAGTPITDDNGSLISIPINSPGGPYQKAPQVIITGEGYGAGGVALLDDRGFVTEIRVTRQGVNYPTNTADDNGLLCVIDSFTMLSPGSGYSEAPVVLVDGVRDVAEAIIDERGFVVSVRTKDRSKRYKTLPEILILGGGGAGARFLPNLVCLDSDELERKGYAKIGTGSYVDCP